MNHRVLNKILSDNTSGSTDLVLKISNFFMKNSDDFELIKNSIQKINSQMGSFEIVMEYTKKTKSWLIMKAKYIIIYIAKMPISK